MLFYIILNGEPKIIYIGNKVDTEKYRIKFNDIFDVDNDTLSISSKRCVDDYKYIVWYEGGKDVELIWSKDSIHDNSLCKEIKIEEVSYKDISSYTKDEYAVEKCKWYDLNIKDLPKMDKVKYDKIQKEIPDPDNCVCDCGEILSEDLEVTEECKKCDDNCCEYKCDHFEGRGDHGTVCNECIKTNKYTGKYLLWMYQSIDSCGPGTSTYYNSVKSIAIGTKNEMNDLQHRINLVYPTVNLNIDKIEPHTIYLNYLTVDIYGYNSVWFSSQKCIDHDIIDDEEYGLDSYPIDCFSVIDEDDATYRAAYSHNRINYGLDIEDKNDLAVVVNLLGIENYVSHVDKYDKAKFYDKFSDKEDISRYIKLAKKDK